MGQDITNNKSGKSPYALVIKCKQQFTHFNCCYDDADDMDKFMQFFIKVDNSIMKHHHGGKERGATAMVTKTVPRQRSGSGNSIEIPMQRRSVRIRVNRIPHAFRYLIQHAFIRSRASSWGYTFEACVSGRFEIVEEGVVHVSEEEVVVPVEVHV